ncbi:hypothetical protein Bca4012_063003 [Brassica carinata]
MKRVENQTQRDKPPQVQKRQPEHEPDTHSPENKREREPHPSCLETNKTLTKVKQRRRDFLT